MDKDIAEKIQELEEEWYQMDFRVPSTFVLHRNWENSSRAIIGSILS